MIELNLKIPFVAAVVGEDATTAVSLLVDAERTHDVLITGLLEEGIQKHVENVWIERCLFPFLSETHFVITAGDLCPRYDILNSKREVFSPTWRGWGQVMAEWANRFLGVYPPEEYGETAKAGIKRRWYYLDFYMSEGLDYHPVADYENWVKQLHKVLEAKDRDYGFHICAEETFDA
jgi:hypothetical protein